MSEFGCDREQEIVSALRSGALGPHLLRHMAACAFCADMVAVTQFLQEGAGLTSEAALPDASFIWHKAQLRARCEAQASATRPIRVFTSLAYVSGAVAALWLLVKSAGLHGWLSDLVAYRAPVTHLTNGYLFGTTLLGATATLLCALFGSSYLLLNVRGGKQHRTTSLGPG
jgi:hypothetical protein